MAEYVLNTPTAVAVGNAVPYNNTAVKGCYNVRHRTGSGIVTIKGGSCQRPSLYDVEFHGNVTGVAGSIQLALYLDGEILPETLMSVVPATATDVVSVGTRTQIQTDCNCSSISARVVTGDAVTVNTASIIVRKEV